MGSWPSIQGWKMTSSLRRISGSAGSLACTEAASASAHIDPGKKNRSGGAKSLTKAATGSPRSWPACEKERHGERVHRDVTPRRHDNTRSPLALSGICLPWQPCMPGSIFSAPSFASCLAALQGSSCRHRVSLLVREDEHMTCRPAKSRRHES